MQIFNTVQQWVNLKTGEAADPILSLGTTLIITKKNTRICV